MTSADRAGVDGGTRDLRIAAISGGMNPSSSTTRLVTMLAADAEKAALDRGLSLDVHPIEIRDFASDVTRMALGGPASLEFGRVLARVERADGLIVASPVYKGAYSGLFKSFFDIVDPHALIHVPVLLGATGGSLRHALVIDQSLRPLFSFFQSYTVPTGVFATNSDCAADPAGTEAAAGGLVGPGETLAARSAAAAAEFAHLLASR